MGIIHGRDNGHEWRNNLLSKSSLVCVCVCVRVCPFVCGGKVHLDGSSTFQQIELAVVQWVHNGMLTKANVITLIEDELHLTWELTQVEQLLLKKAHIYTTSTGDGVISFKRL